MPAAIPADGVSTSTVALSGAPAGHQIRFDTSLSGSTFAQRTGTVDSTGRFTTTIRSSTPGTAIITAQDLTTGETFPASASVTFTPVEGQPQSPPPQVSDIVITDVRAQHPLDARYLQGIPVPNRVDVIVDWKGTTPGRVDFVLNGVTFSQAINGSTASHVFDMGADLREGSNSLRIIAVNAVGQSSQPMDFTPFSVPAPVWLEGLRQAGLMSLPVLASGDVNGKASYQIGFHLPDEPFDIEALRFGVPDADTELEWNIDGQLKLPLDCSSPLEASLSVGGDGFKLLGTKINVEGSGGLRADRTEICAFELPHGFAGMKVEATRNVYRKPVLVMITYFNAAIGATVDQIVVVLHLEEFIGKLGEFYVDGKVHFDAEMKVNFVGQSPHFQFSDLELGGGLGIEGGFRSDLKVVEVKVWAGADGSIKFVRMGPVTWPPIDNWQFDSITLTGEAGAKFRVAWFEQEAKGSIEWKYPPAAMVAASPLRDLTVSDWHLIGHSPAKDHATFRGQSDKRQAFAPHSAQIEPFGLSAAAAVTSVLVSNVYTYPEPSLAVQPVAGDALLLWVHDDVAKPVGQAQEIEFSRWDGSAWSTPAGVTNDNLLDGAPQVAWTGDGKGLAVWQRLNDTLPITATWDITTARKIEIATATYDPVAGTWTPVTLLTNNMALDMTPQLVRNSAGDLLAAWRRNDAGLLSGTITDTDRIVTAFHDSGWSSPATTVDGIPGLVDLAAGYGSGAATLAFTRYFTPTGSVTPTLQLFTATWDGAAWSAPVRRTDDSLGHTDPQVVYNVANQPLLIWLAGHELRLANLTTGGSVTLALPAEIGGVDEFRVVQDAAGNIAAVFTAQAAQRDLFVAFYDQAHNLWGNPVRLTDDTASESYPAPALDVTGRLLMGYAATAIVSVTQTTTAPDTGEIITYTLPTEGQTDLVTLSHAFTRNLTLTNADPSTGSGQAPSTGSGQVLTVSDDHPAPGATVVVSATVRNTGDLALDGVSVAFYDGDPTAGGTLIATRSLPAPLAAGFTATLTTTYTVPTTGGVRRLYAVADPANAIVESDETDNTASLVAFGPDLAIASAGVEHWGGSDVGLVTVIRNLGTTTALTTTLAFHRDTITGTLATTDAVPPLVAGGVITLTTPWNYGSLAAGSYTLVAVANPGQLDFSEVVTTNNTAALTLDVLPDLAVSPLYLWAVPRPDGRVAITVDVANFGSVAAPASQVDLYVDGVFTDSARLTTLAVPALGPAGQATLETSWNPTGPGEHTVYAVVNPDRAITETTWANNVASTAGAAPLSDLDAGRSGGYTRLTWTHLGSSVTRYEVWRSSDPYFMPGDSGSEKRGEALPPESGTQASYLDTGALGTAGTSYFYAILPISASGIPYPASNRVGVFNFALVLGSP